MLMSAIDKPTDAAAMQMMASRKSMVFLCKIVGVASGLTALSVILKARPR